MLACCHCDRVDTHNTESLFDRLGGKPAIDAVVDGMYKKIFTDERLAPFFLKTNQKLVFITNNVSAALPANFTLHQKQVFYMGQYLILSMPFVLLIHLG